MQSLAWILCLLSWGVLSATSHNATSINNSQKSLASHLFDRSVNHSMHTSGNASRFANHSTNHISTNHSRNFFNRSVNHSLNASGNASRFANHSTNHSSSDHSWNFFASRLWNRSVNHSQNASRNASRFANHSTSQVSTNHSWNSSTSHLWNRSVKHSLNASRNASSFANGSITHSWNSSASHLWDGSVKHSLNASRNASRFANHSANFSRDHSCPPVCAMWCEHGNVLDAAGCPICECMMTNAYNVQGGLVIDAAEVDDVLVDTDIHSIFGWAIAIVTRVNVTSVRIDSVSQFRRLQQFMEHRVRPRHLAHGRVLVNFTIVTRSATDATRVARVLTPAASAKLEMVVSRSMGAKMNQNKIHVLDVAFVGMEIDTTTPALSENESTSNIVAVLSVVGFIVALLSCVGFGISYRLWKKRGSEKNSMGARTVVVGVCVEGNIQKGEGKDEINTDCDLSDASTVASSRPSTAGSAQEPEQEQDP